MPHPFFCRRKGARGVGEERWPVSVYRVGPHVYVPLRGGGSCHGLHQAIPPSPALHLSFHHCISEAVRQTALRLPRRPARRRLRACMMLLMSFLFYLLLCVYLRIPSSCRPSPLCVRRCRGTVYVKILKGAHTLADSLPYLRDLASNLDTNGRRLKWKWACLPSISAPPPLGEH